MKSDLRHRTENVSAPGTLKYSGKQITRARFYFAGQNINRIKYHHSKIQHFQGVILQSNYNIIRATLSIFYQSRIISEQKYLQHKILQRKNTAHQNIT
jgi:hypothetical protein